MILNAEGALTFVAKFFPIEFHNTVCVGTSRFFNKN